MIMIVVLIVMFAMFYLLLIRPQRKKQQEHQTFVQELQKGDRVITFSGIYGEIEYIDDNNVILKMQDGGKIKFLKNTIMSKQTD